MSPFLLSARYNQSIIVATSYLTRYVETKPHPIGTATEVAKVFEECLLLHHGAPEAVITNRRAAFTSQMMQEVMRLSHTSYRKTRVYHP